MAIWDWLSDVERGVEWEAAGARLEVVEMVLLVQVFGVLFA